MILGKIIVDFCCTKKLNNLLFRLSNQHSSTEKLEAISDKLEIKEIESKKLIFRLENGTQQGKK